MEPFNRALRTYVNASSLFFDAHRRHPAVELCKVTLSVLALRADIERTSPTPAHAAAFPKRHPFATWLSSFITVYAGSILACLLMAESPLKPFCNPNSLLYVTAAWYAVFYSPMDVCFRFLRLFPAQSVLVVGAEIYRVGNIQSGVKYAMKSALAKEVKLKPLLMVLVGVVKGCGGSLSRGAIRLVRSGAIKQRSHQRRATSLSPDAVDNEFQSPTFFSKVSFLAAALYTSYWLSLIPPQFDYAMIHASVHFFFISQRLLMVMAPEAKSPDPFSTIETFVCLILFGKETTATTTTSVDDLREEEEEEEEEEEAERAGGSGRESGDGNVRRRGKKEE